jgi:hypothetical protein
MLGPASPSSASGGFAPAGRTVCLVPPWESWSLEPWRRTARRVQVLDTMWAVHLLEHDYDGPLKLEPMIWTARPIQSGWIVLESSSDQAFPKAKGQVLLCTYIRTFAGGFRQIRQLAVSAPPPWWAWSSLSTGEVPRPLSTQQLRRAIDPFRPSLPPPGALVNLSHVYRGVGVGVPPGASPTPAVQPRRVSLQVRAPPRPALPPLLVSDASISLSLRTGKLAQADAAGAVVGGGGGQQGDPRRQGRARRGHVDGVHEGREARLSYQRAGARLDHRRQDQRAAPRQVSSGSTLSIL